jgi:hypothetical protein
MAQVSSGNVFRAGWLSSLVGHIEGEMLREKSTLLGNVLVRLDGKLIRKDGLFGDVVAHIEGDIIYRGSGSGGTILGRFSGPDEVALAIYFFLKG